MVWKMRRNYGLFVRCIFGVFLGAFGVLWCIFGVLGGILVYFWCIFGVWGGILVSFWCFSVFFACVLFLDEKSAKKCRF